MQIDDLRAQLEATQLVARQLGKEVEEHNLEAESRVQTMDGAAVPPSAQANEEILLWKRRHRSLLGRLIVHRVLQVQATSALEHARAGQSMMRQQVRMTPAEGFFMPRRRYMARAGLERTRIPRSAHVP